MARPCESGGRLRVIVCEIRWPRPPCPRYIGVVAMQSVCRGCAMMRTLIIGVVSLVCLGLAGAAQPGEKQGGQLPPDLRTRKGGNDWPTFLGPTGDSISTEKGLVTPWTPK